MKILLHSKNAEILDFWFADQKERINFEMQSLKKRYETIKKSYDKI
jgi:hypothetical protein